MTAYMRLLRHLSPRHLARPTGLLVAAVGLAGPASAGAAAGKPFTCEGSVLRGSVAGAPPVEPIVANRALPCQNASAGLPSLAAVLPLARANVLSATTQHTGAADRQDQQQNVAAAGVAELGVGSLGSLGLALPLDQVPLPAQLQAVPVDISTIATALNPLLALAGTPALPPTLTVDISAAVRELVRLPSTDVLGVKSAYSIAGAQCVNGLALTGSQRSVAGLTVLGNAIDADTTTTDKPIVDTQTIDPAALDLTKVKVPVLDGLTTGVPSLALAQANALVAQINAQVVATIKALPPVALPIDLLRVSVTPGTLARSAASLTQTALEVKVSALGRSVVDLVIGEAKVGTSGVDCSPPTTAPTADAPAASQAPLACTRRRLVLTDVLRKGDRVRVTGVADKRFVGRFVTITFGGGGTTVGRALVGPDGTFTTTTALPSKKVRSSNDARYQAVLGTAKSLDLKLERRAYVDELTSKGGRVTVRGHLTQPLGAPRQMITLSRRVSCKRMEVVERFKPKADGTFSVTVDAPEGQASAVYRLGTKVRKTAANKKLFPTFTLPQGVDLEQ